MKTDLTGLINIKLFVDSSGIIVESQAALASDGEKLYNQIEQGIK